MTDDEPMADPYAPAPLEDADLERLAEGLEGDDDTAVRLRDTIRHRGDHLYADAVWNLTHIKYEPERAKDLWDAVRLHRGQLKDALGRDVGLRVAAIDYFVNIARELGTPRVIHPDLLEQLRDEATRDPLTGLFNRRAYRQALASELMRSQRYGSEFVVGVFDLDNFKRINDTEGHAVGDRMLREAAEILRRSTRGTDMVTRWGGEEFVVLMPETSKIGATEVAQRIRRTVEVELGPLGVTISGGLAAFPADGADERSLFVFADRALYRAKSEGKNRISLEPQERRRFRRVEEEFSIRVVPGGGGDEVESKTSTFGQGGFSFTSTQPPAISAILRGTVEIDGESRRFQGRVVYVEESVSGSYDVGVQFLDASEVPSDS